MEPKFKLHFVVTYQMWEEAYRRISRKSRIRFILFFHLALAAAWWYIGGFSSLWEIRIFIYCCLFCTVTQVLQPCVAAWRGCRQEKRNNDGMYVQTVVLAGDHLEIHSGGMTRIVPWESVTEVRHYRHSYVLILEKRSMLQLDPDAFVFGNFMDFKRHLREKCPTLQIPE